MHEEWSWLPQLRGRRAAHWGMACKASAPKQESPSALLSALGIRVAVATSLLPACLPAWLHSVPSSGFAEHLRPGNIYKKGPTGCGGAHL